VNTPFWKILVTHVKQNLPPQFEFLGRGQLGSSIPSSVRELDPMIFFQDLPSASFKVGEKVRITAGAFASFSGVIEEIDDATSRMKVALSVFGRPTPVEIEFGQVEKL
jgi:transcription termination/antitermination protein NusG